MGMLVINVTAFQFKDVAVMVFFNKNSQKAGLSRPLSLEFKRAF